MQRATSLLGISAFLVRKPDPSASHPANVLGKQQVVAQVQPGPGGGNQGAEGFSLHLPHSVIDSKSINLSEFPNFLIILVYIII